MTVATQANAQRDAALRRANSVRTRRSRLKRELKAGRRSIDALLAMPPAEIATMEIYDLLICLPGYGDVRVNLVLGRAGVSPTKLIRALSERQRGELRRLLRAGRSRGDDGQDDQHGRVWR